RAVLILRDVLGWPAKDVAELLGDSVNSVNSALQRARAGMREHLPAERQDWTGGQEDAETRELVRRHTDASVATDGPAPAPLRRACRGGRGAVLRRVRPSSPAGGCSRGLRDGEPGPVRDATPGSGCAAPASAPCATPAVARRGCPSSPPGPGPSYARQHTGVR